MEPLRNKQKKYSPKRYSSNKCPKKQSRFDNICCRICSKIWEVMNICCKTCQHCCKTNQAEKQNKTFII